MNFKLSFFLLSCPIKIEPKSAIFETKAISSVPEYPNINKRLNTKETINNNLKKFTQEIKEIENKYLKENKPEVLAIALEPEESPAISKGHGGVHKIQGIGTGFIPENFNKELMDEIYTVSSDEAINETKNFVRTTGIGVGISSGAAIAGAKKVAAKYPDKKIVTILPDGVDKYLSMLEFDEVTYVEV